MPEQTAAAAANPDPGAANPAADPNAAAAGFMGGLSTDDTAYATGKGWDKRGIGGVIKDYRELEGKIGQDSITLPSEKATPEELDKFYAATGRPAEAAGEKGYQFKAADGVEIDGELDGWFRGAAFKHGLSETAAAGLFADWNETQAAAAEAFQVSSQKDADALKAEKGDAWDAFMSGAKQAITAFVPRGADGEPDGDILDVMEKQLGTGPLLRIWGAVGEKIANFGVMDGGGGGGGMATTPATALAEIKKIQRQRNEKADHPLNSNRHPNYQEAAAHWAALHKIAYPEKG